MAYVFPTRIWQHIFLYVDHLDSTSRVSTLFQALTRDPSFRTMYFLMRTNKLQLFHYVYKHHLKLLTVEQIYSLLDFGAVLPKYFVETVYRNMTNYPQKRHISEQALEYLVAKGRLLYKESLSLEGPLQVEEWKDGKYTAQSSPSSSSDSKMRDSGFQEFSDDGMSFTKACDDHMAFNACFDQANLETKSSIPSPNYDTPILMAANVDDVNPWANTKIDIDRLSYIVYYNHYYPALHEDATWSSSSRLFRQLYRLWKEGFVNLVNHLVKYSGCDYGGDLFLSELLNDSDFDPCQLDTKPLPKGIQPTKHLLFLYLQKNPAIEHVSLHLAKFDHLVKVLNQDKDAIVKQTLSLLFQYPDIDGGASIHMADKIIDYYQMDEEAIADALFVHSDGDDFDSVCFLETKTMSMVGTHYKTKYGAEWGGLKDSLWQLIMARLGVGHCATVACLNDLAVGGFGYHQEKSFIFQWMFPAYIRTLQEAQLCRIDSTGDSTGRDSLMALLEAGVQPEPSIFTSILSSIAYTKRILGRHIQFFAIIEEMLLNLKLPCGQTYKFNIQDPFQQSRDSISPVTDCDLEDDEMIIYRTVSSHISWLSVFHSDCLERSEFRLIYEYEKSQKRFISSLFYKPKPIPLTDSKASIARLFDSIKSLFKYIKGATGKQPTPFYSWLKEMNTSCI